MSVSSSSWALRRAFRPPVPGPHGRIYLMKQVLEGMAPTRASQQCLGRGLSCRQCETTCPSGVRYGHLADIGRRGRGGAQGGRVRAALAAGGGPVLATVRFGNGAGQSGAAAAAGIAQGIGARRHPSPSQVVAQAGTPTPGSGSGSGSGADADADADADGRRTAVDGAQHQRGHDTGAGRRQHPAWAEEAGCCCALRIHLTDHDAGLANVRRNINAWWPQR
jgi:glycolate oxidase iron-sulfur subunit